MEQQRSGFKYKLFMGDSMIGQARNGASSSGSGSPSSLGKGSAGFKQNDGFVKKLGFKFDVANFDINAVSPQSW